jgi:hypothetical protein
MSELPALPLIRHRPIGKINPIFRRVYVEIRACPSGD